jgi:hypothetical protein
MIHRYFRWIAFDGYVFGGYVYFYGLLRDGVSRRLLCQ